MAYLELIRTEYGEKETLGKLSVMEGSTLKFECKTLELPWLNNQSYISCIPTGKYQLRRAESSPKISYPHLQVLDVPNRTGIAIHIGNFNTEIEGCILVGKDYMDINLDKVMDLTSSEVTLQKILLYFPPYTISNPEQNYILIKDEGEEEEEEAEEEEEERVVEEPSLSYIEYTITKSEINTVSLFFNSLPGAEQPIIAVGEWTIEGFGNYTGGTSLKNIDRIFNSYTFEEKEQYKSTYQNPALWGNLLLKKNTLVLLPKNKINREILAISGKNQDYEEYNYVAFLAKQLKDLILDPNYEPVMHYQELNVDFPSCTVWLWSRAFSKQKQGELEGSLLDISKFVMSLRTSVSSSGGNFDVTLSPIISDFIKGLDYNYVNSNFLSIKGGKEKDNIYKRNFPSFLKLVSANDLIFIRFETLKLERRYNQNIVWKGDLPNKVYDMIGLVDGTRVSTDPEGNVSINVFGRDLMKVLIDDACYFYVLQFAADLYTNISEQDKLFQRNMIHGDYLSLFLSKTYLSISDSLKFVINHLSNMGIVPDSLFSKYKISSTKDKRTYVYRLDTKEKPSNKKDPTKSEDQEDLPYKEELANGVWQIIKLAIDKNVSFRRTQDSTLSQPDGSLINHFHKVCQEPFVEFFGDTYGDMYYFIVRRPPFDGDAIKYFLKKKTYGKSLVIDIREEDIFNDNLSFDEDGIYSWYEIHPQNLFAGQNSEVALAYIPAVFFPIYADIWGNRRYSQPTNYVPYTGIMGNGYFYDREAVIKFVVNELKYLIDINCYLPFTRKGSITIAGDRRIKRGNFVRLLSTGEIFYVDIVTHSLSISERSIDRNTTLQVSRGMREKFIDFPKYNYFNIIDTEYIKNELIKGLTKAKTSGLTIRSDYGVNGDVFDFFFSKKQFDDEEKISVTDRLGVVKNISKKLGTI